MKQFSFLILFFLTSGCATTYKDFKVSKVRPDESVAIGKVKIKYNGKDFNKECKICFKDQTTLCQTLTEEAYVFQNVKKGEAILSRIECKDVSIQHFDFAGAQFLQQDDVNYFGEIDIEWINAGGFKATDLFGIAGAIVSESRNDGLAKLNVKAGNAEAVVKHYEDLIKQPNIKFTKNLLKVKASPDQVSKAK